jgi:hypothetical protein
MGPVMAVAAVLLVLLIGVPVVLMSGNGDSADTVAGDTAADMDAGAGSAESAVGAEELGEFSDDQALRSALVPRVGEELIGMPDSAAGGGTGDASEDRQFQEGLSASTTTSAASATTAVPPAAVSGSGAKSARSAFRGTVPCLAQANRDYGERVEALVYAATLTWQGTPSSVLVYQVKDPKGPVDKLVVVLARNDCTLLTSLGL